MTGDNAYPNCMPRLYEGFFNNLALPALILDTSMNVLCANQTFLKHRGLERGKVVGRTCYEVFHSRKIPCPANRCRFPEVLAGRDSCVNLHEYLDAQGEVVFEEVHLMAIRDPAGRLQGVIELVQDVSAAKRHEGSLMEANEFLNRLLDSMVGVVVAADLDGRILFVNKSVTRMLGFTVQEVVGKPISLLAPKEEVKKVRSTLEREGQALGVISTVSRKDGEWIPVRVNSSFVYRRNQPVATVSIFTDLRERVRLEESLIKARMQLVQSDKLAGLGRMAAGIAHEINNPLTGITVYASLVRDGLPEHDPARADLECILEDAERCRDIVKGLLDYSRQSELQVEELDLNRIVEDAFNLIRDNSVFLKVDIVRHLHEGPLTVEGDAKLLRQVFINLLMNAVDAMRGEGRLTVATYVDQDNWRVVEVSDTGPGINQEDLERVFDPFFTTKSVGRGTGLGLSVVYGVLARHGGTVAVKQTGEQGTTFQVRIPPEASGELKHIAATYHPSGVKPLAEDEEIM